MEDEEKKKRYMDVGRVIIKGETDKDRIVKENKKNK